MRIIIHSRKIATLSYLAVELFKEQIRENELHEWLNYLINKTDVKVDYLSGELIYTGKDSTGNELFLLERKRYKRIVCKAITGFKQIFHSKEEILFFDLSPYENNIYFRLKRVFSYLGLKNFYKIVEKKGLLLIYPELSTNISHFKRKINP